MDVPAPSQPGNIALIAEFNPPSPERAWHSAPHPRLPLVASCSSDKSVRIYSLTSFNQVSVISGGHKRSVRSCAWKPGLKHESALVTGSFDASVGVWRRDDESAEGTNAREIDFTVAGVNDDNLEEEEDDEEWRFALVLDGHDSEVKSVAWSAGGTFLATCSRDKSVWIWEEVGDDDYETIAVLQEHTADVKCVSWHPEEELLASGSYDDDIRLWREDIDDWGCVGLLRGHGSTIWYLDWEGLAIPDHLAGDSGKLEGRERWLERRRVSGPRLASCSDDMTIKIWRRRPKERTAQNVLSTIKTYNNTEDWVEEATLPKIHEMAIYAVSWNRKTGRLVSCSGDGRLVVYEEQWKTEEIFPSEPTGDSGQLNQEDNMEVVTNGVQEDEVATTEWKIVANIDDAHGVFEVNHVAWAPRADPGKLEGDVNEDVIVSTGDDGAVKVWSISV